MDLSSVVKSFLEFLDTQKNASNYTLKNYRYYLSKFLEFAQEQKIDNISDVTPDVIQKYRLHLSKLIDPKTQTGFKKTTQNYFLIALRSLIAYLAEQRGIAVLDKDEVRLFSHESKKPAFISEDQLKKLLNAPALDDISGLRDRAILSLLAATGIKISELCRLDRNSISLEDQTVSISVKNERTLNFPSSVAENISAYLKMRKDIFRPLFIRFKGIVDPSDFGEKMRLTERSVERMVKKYSVSLDPDLEVTPQILRHSFARTLMDQGENLTNLQKTLGHMNKASTKVYEKTLA